MLSDIELYGMKCFCRIRSGFWNVWSVKAL